MSQGGWDQHDRVSRSASWRSAAHTWTSSLFTTFCGQTKRVLGVRMCWTSTVLTCAHREILVLFGNISSERQLRRFVWYRRGQCPGPVCATWQADCSTVSWSSWNCSNWDAWRCLKLWGRDYGFISTELLRTMWKMSCWPRHIQGDGVHVEGRLRGLLCPESNSSGSIPVGARLRSYYQDYLRYRDKAWQRAMPTCQAVFQRTQRCRLPWHGRRPFQTAAATTRCLWVYHMIPPFHDDVCLEN
jgi:hypothetical protein